MSNVMHSLDSSEEGVSMGFLAALIIGALVLGTGGGYVISMVKKPQTKTAANTATTDKDSKVIGIADKKTFKDQAEGVLKEGGIEGEGTYHLERPGGVSQNVYLTSSTVDFTEYANKKVRVWGATFKADKAGWLMDVGLVEVLQ